MQKSAAERRSTRCRAAQKKDGKEMFFFEAQTKRRENPELIYSKKLKMKTF